MIKKLRLKFVLIIICIVTVLLAAAFGALMYFTSRSLSSGADAMLDAVIHGRGLHQREFGERRAFGVITVDEDGEAKVTGGNLLHTMDEETVTGFADEIIETGSLEGHISKYNLRYKCAEDNGILTIALLDTTQEQIARSAVLNNCLFIGLAALAAFVVVGILLSRWVVKPVEIAWQQNKAFVSDASHELKTPLTVILSNSEMLSERINPSDEKSVRWCSSIHAEALRMKALTEEMLELAKMDEAVDKKMIASDVDLEYLLTDVVLTFEAHAFEEGKEIRFDTSTKVTVWGDAELLRRICVILIDNDIKYSSEGGVIDVKLTENGSARIDVSNSGEEIPPDEAERIFSRFYRTDRARTYNGGHGLGLAILSNIVYMHNGKVWVKSKNGINTFSVLLPIK